MAPSINPLSDREPSYDIADSAAFLVSFTMDFTDIGSSSHLRSFTITRPDPAPGLAIVLRHVASATNVVLHTLVGTDTSVTGREITVSTEPPAGGTAQLTCNVDNVTGNGVLGEAWELRVSATSPAVWAFAVDDKSTSKVTRLVCDPVAGFSTAPPAAVLENQAVNVVAANALAGTAVIEKGAPAPAVVYRWEHTAPIAIMDLPFCGPSQSHTINIPGVYADVSVPITLTVGFDTTCGGLDSAFLRRAVTAPAMTIRPRPQQVALVLDRSGSMAAEDRWTNAKTAARLLTNLFVAIREGIHPDDRIGILVFEDDVCTWHAPPISPKIGAALPLSKLSDAQATICGLALGDPGSCTPIGDGLVAGMDLLIAGGPDPVDPDPVDPDPNAKFTLVLLTDGFENAGTVQVGPDPLQPGAVRFASVRTSGLRGVLNQRLSLFTIGLGATVDQNVLNNLAVKNGYRLINNATELADAFGQMLTVSQEVKKRLTQTTPPSGVPDPSAPPPPPPPATNVVYFTTTTGADKLVLGVLAGSGTIELARRQGTDFVPEGVVTPCDGHIIGSVANLPALGSGVIEWRVIHTVGGVPQELPPATVLVYEDLHVKGDVLLDKNEYRTGDKMRLTVRLRHDSQPIRNAKVRAVLDAPELGLGETLSGLGPNFVPERRRGDSAAGKGALIEEVLRRHKWKGWPHSCPTGIFVDGTDELHDPDGDGNYTNTFAKAFKEGTYTWELLAEGTDVKGNHFDQRIIVSTHVSVKVDPRATKVTVTKIERHPSGLNAARVIIVPQDVRGERLGPGSDHAVIWSLDDGIFEHILNKEPAPVFTDGTYQRVILYKQKERPVLKVSVVGTVLPKIRVVPHDNDDKSHDNDNDNDDKS